MRGNRVLIAPVLVARDRGRETGLPRIPSNAWVGRWRSDVPRLIESRDPVELEGLRLKPYFIAARGREVIDTDSVLKHAAEALRASSVPSMAHLGLGYIVYHAGEGGNWLLVRVWLDGGIVSGLLGRIDGGHYSEVKEPMVECVWEEIPVHHERGAWVRYMMSDPADPEAYLRDTLASGYR